MKKQEADNFLFPSFDPIHQANVSSLDVEAHHLKSLLSHIRIYLVHDEVCTTHI